MGCMGCLCAFRGRLGGMGCLGSGKANIGGHYVVLMDGHAYGPLKWEDFCIPGFWGMRPMKLNLKILKGT